MPDKITKKHKHLTYDQREEIQGCLNRGVTFKAIGQRIRTYTYRGPRKLPQGY